MINENIILVVVVLYKCKIEEAKSITCLSKSILHAGWGMTDLLIYDNSPEYNLIRPTNNTFRFYYLSDYTNSGVSKAYNTAFDLAKKLGKKYILLLDQDTEIPISYCLDLSSINDKIPLIVPRLKCRGEIISPCKYKWGRGSILKESDLLDGFNDLNCRNILNSGALISILLYEKVGGYDETVPLYFSDFNFFNRVRNYESTFFLLRTTFNHDMSSNDESDMKGFISRFRLYCDGAFKCYKSFWGISMMVINVILRTFKVSIKYRTLVFLQIFFISFYANYIRK